MKKMALCATGLLAAMAAACAHFVHYNAGNAELWVGGQLQVEQECKRRGAPTHTKDSRILGCTDFATRTIISIDDPKVIAHEYCHWSRQPASHKICPLP